MLTKQDNPPICGDCGKRPAPYVDNGTNYCKKHVPKLYMRVKGLHPHQGETGWLDRTSTVMNGKMAKVTLENCMHGKDGCYVTREQVQPIPVQQEFKRAM